jgi:GTPase SAR1 family protein
MTAMTGQQRQDSSVRIAVSKIAVVGQRAVGKIAVVEQLAQDSFDMTART